MNNLLLYLAESSLALLMFYAVYALVLSRQTCFKFNRFYLLSSLFISFVIPFLELPVFPAEPKLSPHINMMVVQPETTAIAYDSPVFTQTPVKTESFNYWAWLYGIYAVGVLAVFIFFCCQFLKLYTFIYSHAAEGYYWQRIKVIPTHGEMATFSFWHYILFDNSQPHTPAEKALILRHEQAHLAQKHTLDILYLKLLTILFWFNPLLYFYKKALESTHEYLADAAVLQEEDVDAYATLLVHQVFYKTDSSFGNFFHLHQSLLLKRLTMMKKFKSTISLIRPLLVLPVVCVIAGALAANRPVSLPDLMPTGPAASESSTFSNTESRNIFTQAVANAETVDEQISEPSFPNGKEQLYRFLLQNLRFKPEAFGKDAVIGTVVSIKIDKEGNPENAFAENEDLVNQEINRVIRLMPRWIPAYQDGKALASRYELQLLIDRKAKHSVITLNKLAKNGALDSEGVPTLGSDIIHLGLNPVTGTPKNFLDQEAIVVGEITEPTFPGGQAAMDNYFRENLNLGKVVGNELAKAKEFGLGSAFTLEIDHNGNIKKIPLEVNAFAKMDINLSPEKVNVKELGNNFSNEVISLINNMPQWDPATKDWKPISAKIMVGFGLRHSSQPAKPLKRNEVYSITHEGKILFLTDQIIFWIPFKAENKKTDEGNNTQQSPLKRPQFPGGKSALKEYLSSHTNYPAAALKNKIFGQAIIQATIDADGKVTDFKTLHADNAGFEQEALSVLREMPRWEPALKNGNRTSYKVIFPFVFGLESKQNIPALRLPADRSQLYVQDAITIVGYSQVIPGKTFVKKEVKAAVNTEKLEDQAPTDDKVFTFVEQMAVFPGGEAALNKFIKENLKYPAEAKAAGTQGLVVAQFVVDKTGKIKDVKVVKSLSPEIDAEAIRVIKLMPAFIPARQNGKLVLFQYTMPMRFGF